MAIPVNFVRENFNSIFIAYSYSYIELAINALLNKAEAEMVVLQPYRMDSFFRSAKETLDLYKREKNSKGIPILFTPQGRQSSGGQFFEYVAILNNILDVSNLDSLAKINKNIDSGIWVFQEGDKLYTERNALLVSRPIKRLSDIEPSLRIPVSEATNILGQNRGEAVRAVSIAAPKLIRSDFQHILNSFE